MSEYLLTYLWVGMECVAAVLLFDAFSQRKKRQIAHWIFVACFAFLDATLLNLMSPNMANFGKIVIAVAVYYFFHRLLYIGRRVFSLYIAVIFYATKYSLQGTTQGRYLTGGVPPVRFSM